MVEEQKNDQPAAKPRRSSARSASKKAATSETAPEVPEAADSGSSAADGEDAAAKAPKKAAARKPAAAKPAKAHVTAGQDVGLVPASGSAPDGTPEAPAKPTRARSRKPAAAAPAEDAASAPESAPRSAAEPPLRVLSTTTLLFKAPDLPTPVVPIVDDDEPAAPSTSSSRRRRRRSGEARDDDAAQKARQPKQPPAPITEPQKVKGSTRLEAKKQRRRDGRDASRRRPVITEAEFLARRESVDRVMVVRSKHGRTQIAVLEDGVLVEHYVARQQDASLIGNVYLGRVQNVLPSMEAAFVDIGRGRNAVLYSGEVDWDAAAAAAESDGAKNQPRRIELALKPGDKVLVQVTKDPVGHKGARLTSQVSLPGRYLVYVPNGSMSGISRKLPDTERARLKKILKSVLPAEVGVIVRTAAEGATEEQLTLDVTRLTRQWEEISKAVESQQAPALLHSEPDLLVKIIRDVFNEDFSKLVISGDDALATIRKYLDSVAPDLLDRVERYEGEVDAFDHYRVSEQIVKALDRKVWLPSGGSLIFDRTEAMTVIDVNTGKFVGSGGNLEETVTKNNLEAAEEIARQLRLRDVGGIIVVDFIDMVLESNRELVLRRLVECLARDRTKHQVAEVTSLGLVQMTRKKIGIGLLEAFSETCEVCGGRGIIVHHEPVTKNRSGEGSGRSRRGRGTAKNGTPAGTHAITEDVKNAIAQVMKSTVVHHDDASARPDAAAAEGPAGADATPVAQPEHVPEIVSPIAGSPDTGLDAVADLSADEPPLEPVEILDIPLAPVARPVRRPRPPEAEQILEAVLEALPEPKAPGEGRRGRKAPSAT